MQSGVFGVDAEDAQAILRHTIGIEPLEDFAVELGEVTGNATTPTADAVTAHGAAWILRHAQGFTDQLPATLADTISAERAVHLSEPRQHADGTFTVPVFVDQAEGILSGELQLRIETDEIEMVAVEPAEAMPRAEIAMHEADKVARIAFADAAGTTGRTSLLQLRLRAPMAAQDVNDHIELTQVELNESSMAAKIAAAQPESAFLYPAAPNPFNSSVQIRFGLPSETSVELSVYNVLGQRVRVLTNQLRPAGIHRVPWDGLNDAGLSAASGVYFVQISTPTWQAVRKIALIR